MGGIAMKKNNVLVILIVLLLFLISIREVSDRLDQSVQRLAADIVGRCQRDASRPSCYDREIPKLMKKISMETAFSITKEVQKQDSSYAYCHVLGHALSTAETRKDLGKWKDVITQCPSGVCSNGCIHGAFQERFRSEFLPLERIAEVLPELTLVCEARGKWNPTGLERASCYHALGHLLMYITGADIRKATALCDEVGNKGNSGDFRKVCFDGAFMQIFQPLESEDRALIVGKEVTKTNHRRFCQAFVGPKKTACVSEGWPLYFDSLREPQGLIDLCAQISGDAFYTCIDSVLYVIVVQFKFDLPSIQQYCLGLPKSVSGRCFVMTASRLIETDYGNADAAIDWCKQASQYDQGTPCFAELVKESDFIFQKGSEKLSDFCGKLPNEWKEKCKEKEKRN